MRIIVFVKSILDPEAPPGAIRFEGGVQSDEVSQVLGPFEGNALELAVQLVEQSQGYFSAIAAGGAEQEVGLRRALALGAQAVLRLEVEVGFSDPLLTAQRLRSAAESLGGADIYLFGRQAGDWDLGVTAGLFAGLASLPFVPLVQAGKVLSGGIWLRREISGGFEEGEIASPCVLSVTNGPSTLLRFPKVKDVMLANRKLIEVRPAAASRGFLALQEIRVSNTRRASQRLEGDIEVQADQLAAQLRRFLSRGGN